MKVQVNSRWIPLFISIYETDTYIAIHEKIYESICLFKYIYMLIYMERYMNQSKQYFIYINISIWLFEGLAIFFDHICFLFEEERLDS